MRQGVEVIRGVERVVPDILERQSMDGVGARFRDDVDLLARAGAVLGRVVAGLDSELLDVLEAGVEFERRRDFAVQVARRGIDNR